MFKYIAIAITALTLSACGQQGPYRPYTIRHANGDYERTATKPDMTGKTVAVCNRGPVRNIRLINGQVSHTADITDAEARRICAATIR